MVDPVFRNQGVATGEAELHNRTVGFARVDQDVTRPGCRVEAVAFLITIPGANNPGFSRM